jgi:hypothetical protein
VEGLEPGKLLQRMMSAPKCWSLPGAGIADIDLTSPSPQNLLRLEGDPNDGPDIFFNDILVGGKYINNQKILECLPFPPPNVENGQNSPIAYLR